MEVFMNKEEYQKLVQKYTPSEDKLKNALKAFVVGGLVGVLSIIIYKILLNFNITEKDANIWTILILILVSSICTGLNFFDDWVSKVRCGLIVPITGFSHSAGRWRIRNSSPSANASSRQARFAGIS